MKKIQETGAEARRNREAEEKEVYERSKTDSQKWLSHSKLFAGEALEVGHLALHLFAGGVGGGADALGAELEFVGVGGARQSFVEGDELFGIEIEERLIEGLHTVLAGAGGESVMD